MGIKGGLCLCLCRTPFFVVFGVLFYWKFDICIFFFRDVKGILPVFVFMLLVFDVDVDAVSVLVLRVAVVLALVLV